MLISFGCGNSASNPATPDMLAMDDMTDGHSAADAGNTGVLAAYDVTFDPDTMTLEAAELRGADTWYDLTSFITPYTTFTLISFDPLAQKLIFDMTMTNPTALDVYDVRVLFLATSTSGYSLNNPDDYTERFNPFAPGTYNPFRAFAKLTTDRKFAGGSNHTEQFNVRTPTTVTLPFTFKLLVMASYPDNCQDPYEISNQAMSNPVSDVTSGVISLDTYDHQNNIGDVKVDTTPITGGWTTLTEVSTDHWTATILNTAGATPGKYNCLIMSDSWSCAWNLYDYLEIEVVPGITPPIGWTKEDFPINYNGCSLDLGVIADPGGARDSEILMVGDDVVGCDAIIKYKYHYSGVPSIYAKLHGSDSDNDLYEPYPVLRLDAADDGAFSFTNGNWATPYPMAGSYVYNAMVWTCFDNTPALHNGPAPDDSRYYFDFLSNYDTFMRPIDVCDDFNLGQYAVFTSTVTWSPQDLMFVGTMPNSYTHNNVRYMANLDAWEGIGAGLVNTDDIKGIDVIEYFDDEVHYVRLYILEHAGAVPEIEVFQIVDSASGWGYDFVSHIMTINASYIVSPPTYVDLAIGHDIEILPANNDYKLNPNDPTLCVLLGWGSAAGGYGEIFLYNAVTGAFLESIGDAANPALEVAELFYLDTDDGPDWEIHVSNIDVAGNVNVSVFSYN